MANKKIAFLSLFAYPLFNKKCQNTFGGAEVQLYQIAKKLSKISNFNISFIVGNFNQKTIEYSQNIRIIKSGPKIINNNILIKGIFPICLFFTLLKIKPDIIIQRAAGIETGLLAFYCIIFKKNFLYMTASSIDTNKNYRHMKPISGIFYEFGLKHATKIICQNIQQQKELEQNYRLNSIIIKNSFSIPHYRNKIRKYILWVGTSQSLKQPDIFLNLAKSLPKYSFIMIIPKHNIKIWNKLYLESKTIDNLKFIEKVNFDKINAYYSHAKLFVNTSIFEGFPNTFVQAAMHGTPIISLNINPDNFLETNKCGFCAAGNFNKLLFYTKKILSNDELWQKTSVNAFFYAKTNHNIDTNINEIIKLI